MTPWRTRLAAGLIALVPIAVLLLVGARETGESTAVPRSAYTVVQMNLCLSGRAACFPRVQYPLGISDAGDVIRANRADAATLDEVCESDVDEIADATDLHVRFAAISYAGRPIGCVDPEGRGAYGIAVLTKAPIRSSVDRAYATQGLEQRRWLCVTTEETTLCATHLDVRGWDRGAAVNDAQCAEFARILGRLREDGPVVAGGDMNREPSCAAPGMRATTDADAAQEAGKQHVYATADFVAAGTRIVPMEHTDHDALVATVRLAPSG